MADLLTSKAGAWAGPGPSYFRVVTQIWRNKDTGSGYDLFLRRYIEVKTGSAFNGTTLTLSWVYNGQKYITLNGSGAFAITDTQLGTKDYGSTYKLDAASAKAYYVNYAGTTYTSSTSISYTVPTPKYIVAFDENGGSNGPADQTKIFDKELILSSVEPIRTGYTFAEWNTEKDGSGTSYQPGSSYEENEAVTLYAQWNRISYQITYNGNGGSGVPANQIKYYGTDLILSSVIPKYDGNEFIGWSTSSADEEPEYQPGATYTKNASLTLYAVWKRKGMLHLNQDSVIKKGRPGLNKNGVHRKGIPWIKINGVWRQGI